MTGFQGFCFVRKPRFETCGRHEGTPKNIQTWSSCGLRWVQYPGDFDDLNILGLLVFISKVSPISSYFH